MTCFHPLQAFQSLRNGLPYGKPFFVRKNYSDRSLKLPCGQCSGCRLRRSAEWAIRCVHEASLYRDNCFISLTYEDKYLPEHRSLDLRDFQLFMKRLRKRLVKQYFLTRLIKYMPRFTRKFLMRFASKRVPKVRYFHCGEYGDKFGRPHYHACLFNFDFPDKYLWKMSNGLPLYRSSILEGLWPFGHSSIGTVTFQSAAYVARYIMKKVTGKDSWVHYSDIDWSTGEIIGQRKPEYTTMSRRPGIGKGWLDKYLPDVYPSDGVIINGVKYKPPRFYDSIFELEYPSDYLSIKQDRISNAKKFSFDNTSERLKVREQVLLSKLKMLPRVLE